LTINIATHILATIPTCQTDNSACLFMVQMPVFLDFDWSNQYPVVTIIKSLNQA